METNPKVDWYFEKNKKWRKEIELLRTIVLSGDELREELKWGVPCYTCEGKNVVLIHVFKEYCALLFHKGVLLKDLEHILIRQTEHVQVARQIRFTNVKEITRLKSVLKAYIKEAIEAERSGMKAPMKKTKEFDMPEEFQTVLNKKPALKKAFEALTPGRQRGYLLYFSSAKQAKTRESRIEKYIPQIMAGKGVDD
jgi:uncharacterized protein YdeI (YjbR/CyaY-like superfamily)